MTNIGWGQGYERNGGEVEGTLQYEIYIHTTTSSSIELMSREEPIVVPMDS